jgi:hypothetical protein
MSRISKLSRSSVLYFSFGIYSLLFAQPAFSENWVGYDIGYITITCEAKVEVDVCWDKGWDKGRDEFNGGFFWILGFEFDMDSISIMQNISQINVKIFGKTDPDFVIQTTYQTDCQSKKLRQINAFHILEPNPKRPARYNPNWRGAFQYNKNYNTHNSGESVLASVESDIFEVACGI